MPIRILFVTGSYPPDRCGVGDYTRMLATAVGGLAEAQVSVLTTGCDATATDEQDVAVYRSMPDWSLRNAARLIRQIRELRSDIVHIQYPTQGYGHGDLPWLLPLLAFVCGARIVQTWHEGFNRRDLAKFMLMLVVPGRIVVVREAYLRQIRRPFGVLARWRRPLYINSASTLPVVTPTEAEAASVRARYGVGDRRLLVFFGFIYPSKQIEQLFAIANPDIDHILVVGDHSDQAAYLEQVVELTRGPHWSGKAQVVGFAKPEEAAMIVAVADALVLPLKAGGGLWNTSILAGIQQRTFVLTTSADPSGYDADTNVYYARVDNVAEMRQALETYAGTKRLAAGTDAFTWQSVAARHRDLYRSLRSAQ